MVRGFEGKRNEIDKATRRVRRLYGLNRIDVVQHNVALSLLHDLEKVLSDPAYAQEVKELVRAPKNAEFLTQA